MHFVFYSCQKVDLTGVLTIFLVVFYSLIASPVSSAPTTNQFEIKDLNVEVGEWEFQSQNAHSFGLPARKAAKSESGDYSYDDNAYVKQRHALELEVGLHPKFRSRIGIEFEKERIEDDITYNRKDFFDEVSYDELAVELVYVYRQVRRDLFGLGFLFEYQRSREKSEADSFVGGPILEGTLENWHYILNPVFVKSFGGEDNDHKVDFSYGIQFMRLSDKKWAFGVEAYGTIDRIFNTGQRESGNLFGDHDQHRGGPIIYFKNFLGNNWREGPLTIGIGLFRGFNSNTPKNTLKWSLEYEF